MIASAARTPLDSVGNRGEQAQHFHRLKHALAVAAAAVVAAKSQSNASLHRRVHRRDAALEFQIADRVVGYTGAMLGHDRDLVSRKPNAVGDCGARRQHSNVGQIPDHGAAMLAIDGPRSRCLCFGLIHMGEDRQPKALSKIADALK